MTGVDLQRLQQKRKQVLIVGIAIGVVLLATSDSHWRIAWPNVHRSIQWSGLLMILICILGRTWATLYIGGQKQRELVTKGPYSVVRNPLYLFTLFGAAGIGALSGSLVMAVVCAGFATAVFLSVVRQEEQFLLATFPRDFPSLCRARAAPPAPALGLAGRRPAGRQAAAGASHLPGCQPVPDGRAAGRREGAGARLSVAAHHAASALTAEGKVASARRAPYHRAIAVCPGVSRCAPSAR